jgi:hypothetical protein
MFRFAFISFCLCTWVPHSAFPQVTDSGLTADSGLTRESKKELGSFFDAYFSNSKAITTGDILISINVSSDTFGELDPDQHRELTHHATFEKTTRHRVLFDFPKGRILHVSATDNKTTFFPKTEATGGDLPDEISKEMHGLVIDGKIATLRYFPNMSVSSDKFELDALLKKTGVPHFIGVGVSPFGRWFSGKEFDDLVSAYSSGDHLLRMEKNGDNIVLVMAIRREPDFELEAQVEIDASSYVVLRHSTYGTEFRDGQSVARAPISEEQIKWNDMSGVFVPVSIGCNRQCGG